MVLSMDRAFPWRRWERAAKKIKPEASVVMPMGMRDSCASCKEAEKEMKAVVDAILDWKNNRAFSPQTLTQEDVQMLEKVALATPSSRASQPWHLSLVTNQNLLDQFSDKLMQWTLAAKSESGRQKFDVHRYHAFYHAPLVAVFSTPEADWESRFVHVDCGMVVQNLLIAAQAMGLGSTILTRPGNLFDSPEGEQYRRLFGFPGGFRFAIAVALGHRAMDAEKVSHVR